MMNACRVNGCVMSAELKTLNLTASASFATARPGQRLTVVRVTSVVGRAR
jgi:hypothetical protein